MLSVLYGTVQYGTILTEIRGIRGTVSHSPELFIKKPAQNMKIVVVVALAALALPSGSSALVDVFDKGEAGYYCFKIPDLVLTPSGNLLAFGKPLSLVTRKNG